MNMQIGHEVITARPLRRCINDWTLKEHEILIAWWPDRAEICRRLPHRSKKAIELFAGRCNLTKTLHIWTAAQDTTLKRSIREGVPEKQIAERLGLSPVQVRNRQTYLKLRRAKKAPVRHPGHDLMDSILTRAFALNMTRKELDEACGSVGQFERWSPGRKVPVKLLAAAVEAMEGKLYVEWSEL